MAFEHGMEDVLCERYATRAQALEGHHGIVHAAVEGLL
jgi:hypothetical protein